MAALKELDARRVTALWLGRVGDLIVSTAFLRALKARWPSCRLRLVTSARCAEAAALIPFVDEVGLSHYASRPLANARLALEQLARAEDLLVDLNPSASRIAAAISLISRARRKLAFRKPRFASVYTDSVEEAREGEHMLDLYARLAEALGAPYEPRPELALSAAHHEAARALLPEGGGAPAVLVHPGNFDRYEFRWPEERFAALCSRLRARGARVLLLCGPGEEAKVRALAALVDGPVEIVPPAPLGVVGALMTRADLFVCNITGTTHLASAVGARTFGLYAGYTDKVWRPRGARHAGVVAARWDWCRDLTVDEVWDALVPVLDGLPGLRRAASAG